MQKLQRILAFLLITFLLLISQSSGYDSLELFGKRTPKTQDANTPAPADSTAVSSDFFRGEKPADFKCNPSKIKSFTLYSCGYKYEYTGYEVSEGEILIPLSERTTDILLDRFGTDAKYNRETQEIVFTRSEKTMRMKIDYKIADFCGEKREIPVPPRVINGMVHISPNSFAKFLWACFMYDEKRNLYYLDPFLMDVQIENQRGLCKVVAKGTGPLRNRILKLRKPNRFVVDVMNACLDGKARSINHPDLGPIRFSQHMLKGEEGNIVRIVIPESENYEIALSEPRSTNYVETELRNRNSSAPVQDMAVQKIDKFEVEEDTDEKVTLLLETSGPVQMEWNRLLSPDDRFFIDIPGAFFPDKKDDFTLKSDFLPSVKIAQFSPKPDPKVRIVLALEGPKKVEMKNDEKNPNRVRIIITKDDFNPNRGDNTGFMVTYYPSRTSIVCIDPGHGGSDPGVVNRRLKPYEKDVTLDICQRLKALLKHDGWTVAMTRNSDRDVTYPGSPDSAELGARSAVANGIKSHIFVSVHINASVNQRTCGFGTYWYKEKDATLAKHVQKSLVSSLNCATLGTRRERFFVLAHSKMPSILIECGFISNQEEAKLLSNPQFRQKIAQAIMDGLKPYSANSGKTSPKTKKPKKT